MKDKIAELECQRAALRAEVEHEQAELNTLLNEAQSWQRAKAIRSYLTAVKKWAERNGTLDEYTDWLGWAHEQADRIDPLSLSPSSVLDTPREQYRKLDPFEILNEDGSIERIWG